MTIWRTTLSTCAHRSRAMVLIAQLLLKVMVAKRVRVQLVRVISNKNWLNYFQN